MSNVKGMFIAPLLAHYHEPPSEFITDLETELDVFDDAVLVEAARQIKRSHDRMSFPRLADCLKACEAAMAVKMRARSAVKPALISHADWLDRQAHAKAMLKGLVITRQSASEGWFPGLWDFTADKGRLPVMAEIPALRKRAIETHQVVVESQGHKLLGELARSMVTRYAQRQQEVCL